MKRITRLMIDKYNIKKLGYDFMGYKLNRGDIYTYHHLIIPRRHKGPETIENGAVLCGESSHPYLHLIECYDYEKFLEITSEMIDMNIKGKLDNENLQEIDRLLCEFEAQYGDYKNKKGKPLIKEIYKRRAIPKD